MTTITTRPAAGDAPLLARLWADRPGIPGFLSTVDHKRIGYRYLITAFAFLVVGGVEALLMRMQLAGPEQDVLGAEAFNQLMTMHGTTMIFLFNTPVLAGFGNYLIPLQIGARDMAFPRLNALSYWIYLFAGLLTYSSFLFGTVPDGGWFAYTPLTGPEFSPGVNLDFWAVGVTFVGISTTLGAVNFIVTIFRLRAPGMSFNRLPILVWSFLVMSFMVLFAVPAITLGEVLLELDRVFGMQFYDPRLGGDPVLYQHLFWIWGHPEVYILLVPATGMVSMIIPTFSRHRLVAYTWVATALVAIGFLSFGVWVHHMFAVGVPILAGTFFAMASLLITIPSGIQFFAWLATIWQGRRPIFSSAFLFSLGFLVVFLLGGVTGVMVAVLPFDLQVHDSYFVVAHFHYVLVGGVVFPVFAGIYHWLPKMTGRLASERWGKVSFWSMLVGFNAGFFPMHVLGLLGMPRRVYTYHEGLGWEALNLLATVGVFLFGAGVLVSILNWVVSRHRGPPAPQNPWSSDSLEWATTSPPPEYNFAAVPLVEGRHPIWDVPEGRLRTLTAVRGRDVVTPEHPEHETPGTTVLDADRLELLPMPAPTAWPFVLALGTTVVFVGVLVESLLLGTVGTLLALLAIVVWTWRADEDHEPPGEDHRPPGGRRDGEPGAGPPAAEGSDPRAREVGER